ncbi:MAG: DUF1822 family protein [Spirulinaceae cyanobacterium]
MTALLNSGLMLPIPASVQQQAQQFAARQPTPRQGVQVYLNTLAVWTVHQYLTLMQIPTALAQSDSWQPGTQSLLHSADLLIPAWGRLECLAFRPGQAQVSIAPGAIAHRWGLVGVEVSDRLNAATLLGFLPAAPTLPATVQRQSLRSLDELLARLSTPPLTRLRAWLQQEFDPAWQTLQDLLAVPEAGLALRTSATCQRAKQLPWAILAVQLQRPETETYQLTLQLHPLPQQTSLPPDLTLRVLTADGQLFRELTTRSQDAILQYTLQAQSQEQFTVQVVLGAEQYREQFEL